MAERGDLSDDLYPGWEFPDWDASGWNDSGWDTDWANPAPAAPRPHWYHNTRLLGTAIGLASATLVTSTVLLLTVNSPGDFPTAPLITKVTSTAAPTTVSTPSPAPVSSSETSTSATETEAVSTPEPAPGPLGLPSTTKPSPSVEPTRPQRSGAGTAEVPRLPLSRNPMSFTPSPVPRP